MYDNDKLKTIKPSIFTKKLSDNYKTILFNKITSTLGPMRYFPPGTQEWFNSIYAYDHNYIKNITIADKNLSRLIKSYFNLYFSNKLLCSKRISTRLRRLTINKIFISKAELKHTNSKVIITLYAYNEERRNLVCRMKRLETMLFTSINYLSGKFNENKMLSFKNKLNIIKYKKENIFLKSWLDELRSSISERIRLEKNILITIKNLKDMEEKQLEIKTLEKNLEDLLSIIPICERDSLSYKYCENIYKKFISKTLLEKEMISIAYYKLLLNLNKSKFEDKYLLNLRSLISKIYNKEVEFNIVNLKAIYLNSDIFTQVISLKLKNRDNGLLRVLRSFLYMVKLPKTNVIRERFGYINPNKLWVNIVKNLRVNYLSYNKNNKDNLNQLLFGLLKSSNFFKRSKQYKGDKYYRKSVFNRTTSLLNYILNSLKHKNMGGVRLEAKGRLTRRFTASRSVFKIKWKGSLKNIDSSYKGLSSVMLRGHIKSNVQYSIINSKTRNGAFGLKGWISGK
jgi:hypothetical protein